MSSIQSLTRLFTIAIFTSFLSACGIFGGGGEPEEPIESNEQAYYEAAKKSLKAGNYNQTIELLEDLESRYPFGRYAEQAQLDLIFAHYRAFNPEAARASADRFIRLHPRHPKVDYAYYMRGLSAYTRDLGLFERYLNSDRSKRDPGSALESIADFSLLLARFPNSEYAPDARARMIALRNQLAAHEIHVARYYLKRQAYVATANRGRYVVENYQETPAVADGLALMVEAYQQLGLTDLADQSLSVLKLNYPNYPALRPDGSFDIKRSTAGVKRSWLNRLTFGLLGKSKDQS